MSQLSECLENDAPRNPEYLPVDHRQGMEWALKELPAGEYNETAVKAGIRKLRFDSANPFRTDAETDDSQGDIYQINLAKGLDR